MFNNLFFNRNILLKCFNVYKVQFCSHCRTTDPSYPFDHNMILQFTHSGQLPRKSQSLGFLWYSLVSSKNASFFHLITNSTEIQTGIKERYICAKNTRITWIFHCHHLQHNGYTLYLSYFTYRFIYYLWRGFIQLIQIICDSSANKIIVIKYNVWEVFFR